jgi:glycogen operon protein
MTETDWYAPTGTLGMFLSGDDIGERDPAGRPVADDSFLLLLNASHRDTAFTLPGPPWAARWRTVLDTSLEDQSAEPGVRSPGGAEVTLRGRSLLVLAVAEGAS